METLVATCVECGHDYDLHSDLIGCRKKAVIRGVVSVTCQCSGFIPRD